MIVERLIRIHSRIGDPNAVVAWLSARPDLLKRLEAMLPKRLGKGAALRARTDALPNGVGRPPIPKRLPPYPGSPVRFRNARLANA